MFWRKKPRSSPLGVRLDDLMELLKATSIRAKLDDRGILAQHEHYKTRIEVVPPESSESENGPIQAVVRVIAELPAPVAPMFRGREASATATFNPMAALGALYQDGSAVRVGSRLTIYEAENAWRALHLPLLAFSAICGADAILGGIRRTLTDEKPRSSHSHWTERDLAQVEQRLNRICVCTTGGLGFTAEFGLSESAITAAAGHQNTALFQLRADQPHPELGGGLFGLLQLPHRTGDTDRLARTCHSLNQMEMAAHDLPPHFGAWCPGKLGNNPAYVFFLPNALHSVSGIAVNATLWAMHRVMWASAVLPSLGFRAP